MAQEHSEPIQRRFAPAADVEGAVTSLAKEARDLLSNRSKLKLSSLSLKNRLLEMSRRHSKMAMRKAPVLRYLP
jgi:hypothetical protein